MGVENYLILISVLMLSILELYFYRSKQEKFSKGKKEDISWYLIHTIVSPFINSSLVFLIGKYISFGLSLHGVGLDLISYGITISVLSLVIFQDFVSYWSHRFMHRVDSLWGIHKVHHTTTELNVLSSFRHSIFENIVNVTIVGSLSGLIIVSDSVRGAVGIFFSLLCLFQHGNISIVFPRWFREVFITPRNHFWHHSKETYFKGGQNFGFLLCIWDKVFGTYYFPDHINTELGVDDESDIPKEFYKKLLYPILKE